jgi:hypothetical protein
VFLTLRKAEIQCQVRFAKTVDRARRLVLPKSSRSDVPQTVTYTRRRAARGSFRSNLACRWVVK